MKRTFRTASLLTLFLAACATPHVTPSAGKSTLYITDAKRTGFSVYQAGRLVDAPLEEGYLTYRLSNRNFLIKTAHPSVRIYLSEKDVGEVRQTKKTKLDVLSPALVGASENDSDSLIIADYNDPLSSSNSIDPSSGLKPGKSSPESSFEVKNFYFLKTGKEVSLAKYNGTLFGYAWVDLNNDSKIGKDEVSRIKVIISKK